MTLQFTELLLLQGQHGVHLHLWGRGWEVGWWDPTTDLPGSGAPPHPGLCPLPPPPYMADGPIGLLPAQEQQGEDDGGAPPAPMISRPTRPLGTRLCQLGPAVGGEGTGSLQADQGPVWLGSHSLATDLLDPPLSTLNIPPLTSSVSSGISDEWKGKPLEWTHSPGGVGGVRSLGSSQLLPWGPAGHPPPSSPLGPLKCKFSVPSSLRGQGIQAPAVPLLKT